MYPHGVENLASELDHTGREPLTVPGDHHQPIDSSCLQQWPVNKEWYHDTQIIHTVKSNQEENSVYLENSGCFLMTSLRVAKTAAIVSSDVPASCWFPAGNFCTRSRMAYFPIMMGISYLKLKNKKCNIMVWIRIYVLITYELLVSLVNGKISEGSGHSTNHFVHFHPQ